MLYAPCCCDTAVGEKKSIEKSAHAHCTVARAARSETEDAGGRQRRTGEQCHGEDPGEDTCSPCGNTDGCHVHRELPHPEQCDQVRRQR
eukprot:5408082-Amphidinium_carterae.1